jgi:PKD repeat protein
MDGTPDLAGPSLFARSLSVTATPDSIVADGSQSTIVATLVDTGGGPISGVPLQVVIEVGGVSADFGSLSSRTVYTGSNGKAQVTYAAPVMSGILAGTPAKEVWIYVTQVGSNYETVVKQHATIKVTPPPVPPPVLGAPQAGVTYVPSGPKVGQLVTFDASSSLAVAPHSITSYFWDFGDAQPNEEHGVDASHAYMAAGTYTAVLAVIDDVGRSSATFKTIVVTP